MLIDLPADARAPLRPLFDGSPAARGLTDAVLEGTMGLARADDAERPAVTLLRHDFVLLAGDPDAPAARELVSAIGAPATIAPAHEAWEPLLREVWGERLQPYERVGFSPGDWDRDRLQGFLDALPDGYALKRVDMTDAARFEALADSLVYNFKSLEDFVARGVGFGIEYDGRFVSGCSSYAISSRSIEFEIQTHRDHRQRGLATVAASALILYCIDSGLEPCWDAHNPISANLAKKLGFIEPHAYTAYEVD